ncbi:MAG: endonuclease/exonuclease/phosphatase family protein, partial [Gillisia sp.]
MNSSRKIFRYFIIFLCVLLILASLLSLVYDLPYWYSKVLDFPREQYLIAGLALLIIFILLNKNWNRASYFLVLGLLGTIAIQSTRVLPYLIGKKTVPDAPAHFSEDNSFSIMIANVLIKNRDSQDFLKVVRKHNPDIVMAMEVNKWWIQQLSPLKKKYSYVVEIPNEAAYGLALYSRFPLKNKEIKYLKHQNVPSLHCDVTLPGGKKFRFHAVHPVAPFPSDKYPDNEGEDEVALSEV